MQLAHQADLFLLPSIRVGAFHIGRHAFTLEWPSTCPAALSGQLRAGYRHCRIHKSSLNSRVHPRGRRFPACVFSYSLSNWILYQPFPFYYATLPSLLERFSDGTRWHGCFRFQDNFTSHSPLSRNSLVAAGDTHRPLL